MGHIIAKYVYDAWGNCEEYFLGNVDGDIKLKNATQYHQTTDRLQVSYYKVCTLNPFRYRGYYYDTETELYFLQTRYYDPEVGRFISQDSVEYADPEAINGLNLYAYCGNNPVMGYDPTGTWDWGKFWRTLAVVVTAIVVVAAVAAVTVMSGGSAAPVLIGAGVGFIGSGAISAVTQYAATGTVDLSKVFVDAAIGGVLGTFGGSALGTVGMTIAGGATGFLGSAASDWVAGNPVDWGKAALAGALGAAVTFVGGPGAQYGNLGARQAALATKAEILNKGVSGYRHATNYYFALKSNAARLARVTSALNQTAINSIIRGLEYNIQMTVYQALLLN